MDNKPGRSFVIKQSEGRKFMHKMHQNAFGGRVPPGPTYTLPQTPQLQWGCLLLGGGRERGERAYLLGKDAYKGREVRGPSCGGKGRVQRWYGSSIFKNTQTLSFKMIFAVLCLNC